MTGSGCSSRFVSCALAVWLAPLLAGQEPLSLEQAVQRALRSHPRLAVESARIAGAEGLIKQAGVRPNPRLTMQSENWTPNGPPNQPIVSTFTDQFLFVSQMLETAGKRRHRIGIAEADAAAARDDREVSARAIAARVKMAYWAAAGAQRVVDLLKENQQNLLQTVRYHELQLQEGTIAEADLVRVRLEHERGSVILESAVREAGLARLALQGEMGEQSFPEVRLTDTLDAPESPAAATDEAALSARADIQRARRAVQQAQAHLRLQQAAARPDVEVLGGYKRTAGYNTMLFGVQVSLPLAHRNEGNIAAAASEIRAAEAAAAALEAHARAEIAAARQDVEARRRRIASSLSTSLAAADQSAEIARAAYREGATDLLRLLDAERTHIELEVLNARMQMEYRQSLVTLETVLGANP